MGDHGKGPYAPGDVGLNGHLATDLWADYGVTIIEWLQTHNCKTM